MKFSHIRKIEKRHMRRGMYIRRMWLKLPSYRRRSLERFLFDQHFNTLFFNLANPPHYMHLTQLSTPDVRNEMLRNPFPPLLMVYPILYRRILTQLCVRNTFGAESV